MLRSGMVALSGRALLAGVIGWPVQHSRSPRLHGFWLERYRIDGAYVPLPVAPGRLALALRGLAAAGFRGCNVTMPHKQAAAELCDSLSEAARHTGAVNTLVFHEGRIEGSATDGEGFLANLGAHGVDPGAGPALVLGAGGAARDIVLALRAQGVAVAVANRTLAHARALAERTPDVEVVPWEERGRALGDRALLVNATAAGMAGMAPLAIDLDAASPALVVADIVTAPAETALLGEARRRGLRTVSGLGMLAQQAVPGFEAWFGVRPVVDHALLDFLARS